MTVTEISTQTIKELREKTGAGIMECKNALAKAEGDMKMAEAILKEKAIASASKKSGRTTKEGKIESYIHTGSKVGVMLEINCETDFVAKTEDFQMLAREIAMQVAALKPIYLSREEVSEEEMKVQREIYAKEAREEGKKEEIIDKIVDGKMNKYYEAACLLEQPYMRDDSKKIEDIIKEVVGKLGENITVSRFVRYQVGE
ncbi:MAG: translation elongation factor Ts [Armatimonadota bacterium]